MKKILTLIKKIVIALCFLYTVNLIIIKTGIIIPINIFSIGIVTFLGLPSIIALVVLYLIIM